MTRMLRGSWLSALLAVSLAAGDTGAVAGSIGATHPDVSFFVVGKSTVYEQDVQGRLGPAGYYLFAEVFLMPGGTATSAKLDFPGGSLTDFSVRGGAVRIKRRDFATQAELDAAFPNGTYAIEVQAPGGNIAPIAVELRPKGNASPFPTGAQIQFRQADKRIRQDRVDPKLDLIVSWPPFEAGRADPNGILGDVAFVIMTDCAGNPVARSEVPFKETPSLSYADRSFRVPAERLGAATAYKLLVEHADLVDTRNRDGVVGLGTYPTVTNTILSTAGAQAECAK